MVSSESPLNTVAATSSEANSPSTSTVPEAIREAFVNTLIHADFRVQGEDHYRTIRRSVGVL